MPGHETLFEDIDSMDPDRYARHLSDNVVMRFGNSDPMVGRVPVCATHGRDSAATCKGSVMTWSNAGKRGRPPSSRHS